MKNKLFKNVAAAFCLAVLLSGFTGCGSTPKNSDDAYYTENLKDFSNYKLSNGIPVIFKKTSGGQIFVLRMVFEGGTPLVGQDKAGIEELTLDLMFHGSKNYSYEDIQAMQYNISFTMNDSAGRDYSVAGIKCLEKDLDSVLAVFADGILTPVFSQQDFDQFMVNAKSSLVRQKSDPSSQLSLELEKCAFGDSVYKSSADITEESVNSITLDDVKAHWKKLLDSGRIKFVVVANMDDNARQNFVSKLDSYFGTISAGGYNTPVIPKITVAGEDVKVKNEQAGSSAYAVGFFDCPERYDRDYVPFVLATMYLDDIFFAEVREKAGAVYTIGSGVLGGKDMLGAISCYKISDKEKIIDLVYDAIEKFPSEKEIDGKLDQYKNKYITSLFGSAQNSTGVAASIITSLEFSGKPETYLKRSGEVQNVKAKEVVDAWKKYISRNPKNASGGKVNKIRWIMVSAD